jgi:hypothetical protein
MDTHSPIRNGDTERDSHDGCDICAGRVTGEHYGRTASGELIGPYDTVDELDRELAAANSESGYTSCACRDCMDVSISNRIDTPELCLLCKDAGCDAEGLSDCERPDAYGAEEFGDFDESPDPNWMNP